MKIDQIDLALVTRGSAWQLHLVSVFCAVERCLACENIRFFSFLVAGDVSRETSPAAKSEEKRMFSQAKRCQPRGTVVLLFDQRTIWGFDFVNKQHQFRTNFKGLCFVFATSLNRKYEWDGCDTSENSRESRCHTRRTRLRCWHVFL